VNPESEASPNCDACGTGDAALAARSTRDLAKTFVVVVACAACRIPFVVLSRN